MARRGYPPEFRRRVVELAELHRAMKSNGVLSFSDHHMKEGNIVRGVTASGLFELSRQGKHTFSFTKRLGPAPA